MQSRSVWKEASKKPDYKDLICCQIIEDFQRHDSCCDYLFLRRGGREVHLMSGMFASSVFKTILKRLLLFIIVIIIILHTVIINVIIILYIVIIIIILIFIWYACDVYVGKHVSWDMGHVRKSKIDFAKPVLFFLLCTSSNDDAQIVKFARQMLYPVSHLTIPHQYVKPLRREKMGDRIGYNKDKGAVRGQTSESFWCGHPEGFSVRTEE